MSIDLAETSSSCELTNRNPPLRPLGRALLLTTDFPPALGGISNYLFNVYRQFDLRHMTLIAPQHRLAAEFDSAQAYWPRRFTAPSRVPGVRGAWQVWRMRAEGEKRLQRNSDLVLHCGHVNAAVVARKLKQQYRTPYLLWTYGLEVMDEWLRRSLVPAMLDADLVITISDFTRAYLESCGVPQSRIVRIRPGADPAQFRPGLDSGTLARRLGFAGRPTLLTVSRIVKANRYKGHDVVLRALAKVAQSVPNVAYVIVGEGDDLGWLQGLAHEYGVRDNVIFAGRVSDAQLPLFYNACDVFILCSREDRTRRGLLAEGFGIAIVEASACGKPVIAGRSGGIPDAVQDGVTGLLVDPQNVDQVAEAMISLLQNPQLAQALGANGRRWVEAEMNWARAADEFQQAMEQYFPAYCRTREAV